MARINSIDLKVSPQRFGWHLAAGLVLRAVLLQAAPKDGPRLVSRAFAKAEAANLSTGGTKLEPYHGYFRVLKSQGPDAAGGAFDYVVNGKMVGGFALVAWPAEYGVSGIRTLIINHDGVVYEKDLGAGTATQGRQIMRFNPDKSWQQVVLE
jgi:hypothetical protein